MILSMAREYCDLEMVRCNQRILIISTKIRSLMRLSCLRTFAMQHISTETGTPSMLPYLRSAVRKSTREMEILLILSFLFN